MPLHNTVTFLYKKAKLMIAHNNFIEKMEYLAISIKWGYMVSPPISKAP